MPELPEVETVVRSLQPIVGRTIEGVETSGLKLRSPVDADLLGRACVGTQIERIARIGGKYIVAELSGTECLLLHLGMSGRLKWTAPSEPRPPHTHVVWRFSDGELRFIDPRRFGLVKVYRNNEFLHSPELFNLGVEPLGKFFSPEFLIEELGYSSMSIKQFLLDQHRIVGLGNIYASEALFAARVSPRRRADRITRAQARALHDAIRLVLEQAIARRGTSFRDYVDANGASGNNQEFLQVYDRAGRLCPRCGAPIRQIVQAARSTFYCPRCQR